MGCEMTKEEFSDKFRKLWYGDWTEEENYGVLENGLIVPKKTPRQHPFEFESFLWLVSGIHKPTVLEIGTGHGKTEAFYRELLGAVEYISVDKNEKRKPTVCGDSMDEETIDGVRLALRGSYADILFIDGFHSEEAVRSDHRNYRQFVAPGGYIAFHDIHATHNERYAGINKFWNKIKELPPSWDIHYHIDWLTAKDEDGTVIEKQIGLGVIQV